MNTLFISVPILDECNWVSFLLESLKAQKDRKFELWVCVNQPDSWWETQPDICKNNQLIISMLTSCNATFPIHIIDRSSPGKGWSGKQSGVGWARKTLMDTVSEKANPNDIIVSLDADTTIPPHFLSDIRLAFEKNPKSVGLVAPYLHPICGESELDRAMLRYEIGLRYYLIHLRSTGSIYDYTALGSAFSTQVWAYQKSGGMTPKTSGEDFYFLQKLCKMGPLLKPTIKPVNPGVRCSSRVPFGTGPAIATGMKGDWSRYPIFDAKSFDSIRQTIALFPSLFKQNEATPMDHFFNHIFGDSDIWSPLRANFTSVNQFVHACHTKCDALRLFQFLRLNHQHGRDDKRFMNGMAKLFPNDPFWHTLQKEGVSFKRDTIAKLDKIRHELFQKDHHDT